MDGCSPVDVWIEDVQVPVPSIAATRGRTPPEADVAGTAEEAIVVVAAAARKGRKPKVVRTVAIVGPACRRLQGRPLSTTVAVGTQVCLQCRPLSIRRNMPAARAQAAPIVHGVPIVQPAVGQGVACIVVIITAGSRAQSCPCSIVGDFRYSRAISVSRCAQVLRKPALVADLHH